jgi:hypothetical protein
MNHIPPFFASEATTTYVVTKHVKKAKFCAILNGRKAAIRAFKAHTSIKFDQIN